MFCSEFVLPFRSLLFCTLLYYPALHIQHLCVNTTKVTIFDEKSKCRKLEKADEFSLFTWTMKNHYLSDG